MACCIFTAYFMNRLIKACELLDFNIDIKYNDFENEASGTKQPDPKHNNFVSTKLSLSGMTCGACVSNIQTALLKISGVNRASVSLPLQTATVIFDNSKVTVQDIVKGVEEVGYGAKSGDHSAEQQIQMLQRAEELRVLRSALTGAAAMSSVSAFIESSALLNPLIGAVTRYSFLSHLSLMALAIWVQFSYASWIHKSSWKSARGGHVNMDTLISLSLALGLSLSVFNIALEGFNCRQTYFTSCSFLTTVITAGRYLDLLLRRQSATNIVALYRLRMESATVKVRNSEEYVPAILLKEHDEIFVEASNIIPCDCYVIEGASTVDESIMTGEALPVTKSTGDFLLSGTRNLSGRLIATVYREQHESSLDNLIESISTASEQSSDGQEMINTTTSYFVIGVLLLTATSFLASYRNSSAFQLPLRRINVASERAMAVLAAACPCALGLAAPSAIMAGIDAAWSRGIILSGGGRTIERLSQLTHVVLDKTGTLTESQLQVSSYELSDRAMSSRHAYRRLLCAAEEQDAQAQPVARAIFQWALRQNCESRVQTRALPIVRNRTGIPGKGVSCEVADSDSVWHRVHIGNEALLEEADICLPQKRHQVGNGSTMVLYFAIDMHYSGCFTLQDTIRREAMSVVTLLKQQNLDVTLLSGDVATEAARVAEHLGVRVLGAKALPQEKQAAIAALQANGHKVAMVGDGINDAPAQATADVGILLSLSRACVAGAADVVILSPDLHCLPALFDISRRTMTQAKYNVWWAAGYNTVAISFAMGAFEKVGLKADASVTGTMMAFSSAAILGASLYLRRQLRHDITKR